MGYYYSKFRSKPVVVEAMKYLGYRDTDDTDIKRLQQFTENNVRMLDHPGRADSQLEVYDKLHDTWVKVMDGQWIIKGTKGEFYPCDDEVLQQKYQQVSDDDLNKMGIGEALEAAKAGKKIARKNWNAKEQFVYYVPAASYKATTTVGASIADADEMVPYTAYMAIKTVQNTVAPWLASQTDLLADDWFVVE